MDARTVQSSLLTTVLMFALVSSVEAHQQCQHGHDHDHQGNPDSEKCSGDLHAHQHGAEDDNLVFHSDSPDRHHLFHDHRHSHHQAGQEEDDQHHSDDHAHPLHGRQDHQYGAPLKSDDHHHQHSHDHPHSHSREHLAAVGRELEEHDFEHSEHDHHSHVAPLSTTALWLLAMGSSLLVSMASLICLILLPLIVSQGKPSKTVVDGLAAFGAGSMIGDALLHQLPHAFGGSEAHSHNHGSHDHLHEHGHSHSHSIGDLTVGLAVLGGILLFFVVEKIVRRSEELSFHGGNPLLHGHHHHLHKKDDSKFANDDYDFSVNKTSDTGGAMRKRNTATVPKCEDQDKSAIGDIVKRREVAKVAKETSDSEKLPEVQEESRLVLGYLNLFSDGVHNFTDGMALGSAFLLHGTVGGWSRTLFLLAHEIPQEVGDFGLLVRSGFGVYKALAFNFLSALVALAGTAVALLLGGSPGYSSSIEGFTAGGFIYIAVGAVMPDLHTQGSSLKTSLFQLTALSLGIGVAIVISLAE